MKGSGAKWVRFSQEEMVKARRAAEERKAKRKAKAANLWAPKVKRKKLPSMTKMKKKLWELLSLYIRARDQYLYGHCRICGHAEIQVAYHLIPSQAGAATRYDPFNIVGACSLCNFMERHNRAEYAFKHIKIFGIQRMTELDEKSRVIVQLKRHDIEARILEIQDRMTYLQIKKAQAVQALGLPDPDPLIPRP